jgi:hypothetical protein
MRTPSIFLSHNHRDKPFVRTLGHDLSAMGVRVWLDEAEIKIGDMLIEKISNAIDEMQYLGIVLSPHSVESRWVKEELSQAFIGQLSRRDTVVLPILLADCQIPGFLRGRMYADFRDPDDYEESLKKLLLTVGVDLSKGSGAYIHDPFAKQLGRVSSIYARPKIWHCIFCGWCCKSPNNDYMCVACRTVRPFAGDEATLVICPECGQGSLGVAKYCEWCGTHLNLSAGQSITCRCSYESARVIKCLVSVGKRVRNGEVLFMLRINDVDLPFKSYTDGVVKEMFVSSGQLVFEGTPLASIVKEV